MESGSVTDANATTGNPLEFSREELDIALRKMIALKREHDENFKRSQAEIAHTICTVCGQSPELLDNPQRIEMCHCMRLQLIRFCDLQTPNREEWPAAFRGIEIRTRPKS